MSDWIGIGDSVMLGVRAGVTLQDTFAYKLATATGRALVNLAVGGAKVSQIQAQIDAALARCTLPASLAYMPGENDIVAATPLATFTATINAQIAQVVAAGVPMCVLTPWIYRTGSWVAACRPYVQAVRNAAVSNGVPFIDVFGWACQTYLCEEPALTYWTQPDYQHPSAAGHLGIFNWCMEPHNASAPICRVI